MHVLVWHTVEGGAKPPILAHRRTLWKWYVACGEHKPHVWQHQLIALELGRRRTGHEKLVIGAYFFADPHASTRYVHSIASGDAHGDNICTDGYTDREVCTIYVVEPHQDVRYCSGGTCVTVDDLVLANNTSGSNGFSPGNSGCPVYQLTGGSSVQARGMYVAHTTDATGWYDPTYDVTSAMGVNLYTQ